MLRSSTVLGELVRALARDTAAFEVEPPDPNGHLGCELLVALRRDQLAVRAPAERGG